MTGPRAFRPKSDGVVGVGVPVAFPSPELIAESIEEILVAPNSPPIVFPTDTDETVYYPERALG